MTNNMAPSRHHVWTENITPREKIQIQPLRRVRETYTCLVFDVDRENNTVFSLSAIYGQ